MDSAVRLFGTRLKAALHGVALATILLFSHVEAQSIAVDADNSRQQAQTFFSESPSNLRHGEVSNGEVVVADHAIPQNIGSRKCYKGDIWEISTRHLGCCPAVPRLANPDFRVSHVEEGCWRSSTLQTFFDATGRIDDLADPTVVETQPLTIYYVHGNWMTVENTRERVQTIDRALSRLALRPYRLVVLSWPSERDRGIVNDIRENGECADIQAHYLNFLIQHTSPNSQISLMGFSFGGRTVTGALHLLGGGSMHGVPSQCNVCDLDRKFRVTLVAPAVDRNWLTPNGRFGNAASSIEWMVNLYNSRDPVLRRFRFISRVSDPIAAGFRGFAQISDPRATSPISNAEVIEQFDCGGLVGTSHDEKTYYSRCSHFTKGALNLLWQYP